MSICEQGIHYSHNVAPILTYILFFIRFRASELELKGLRDSEEQWESFDSIKKVYDLYRTPISDYVIEHWRDDDFFGNQFMNGPNPNFIKRCSELPDNFPVTEEMVKPFLASGSSLANEMTTTLGRYPEERFDESTPKQIIKRFQVELSRLSKAITRRNSGLQLPYNYLNPDQIENSVTI
ncbi:hypothetical protein NHX12_025767 [Muraenolepis orangiensis]|uniref:Lipoxygenase domain-containing protein n=1 Tax=Muraenolepis orangiensis TaxID=630683 RepID=A0A9Q0EDT7_9TELE|nr:hypothetical protein NHX12_025767 [Muraenolepis orangiensis]